VRSAVGELDVAAGVGLGLRDAVEPVVGVGDRDGVRPGVVDAFEQVEIRVARGDGVLEHFAFGLAVLIDAIGKHQLTLDRGGRRPGVPAGGGEGHDAARRQADHVGAGVEYLHAAVPVAGPARAEGAVVPRRRDGRVVAEPQVEPQRRAHGRFLPDRRVEDADVEVPDVERGLWAALAGTVFAARRGVEAGLGVGLCLVARVERGRADFLLGIGVAGRGQIGVFDQIGVPVLAGKLDDIEVVPDGIGFVVELDLEGAVGRIDVGEDVDVVEGSAGGAGSEPALERGAAGDFAGIVHQRDVQAADRDRRPVGNERRDRDGRLEHGAAGGDVADGLVEVDVDLVGVLDRGANGGGGHKESENGERQQDVSCFVHGSLVPFFGNWMVTCAGRFETAGSKPCSASSPSSIPSPSVSTTLMSVL